MDGRVINKQHTNVLNFMAPFSLTDLGDTITSEIDDATTIKHNISKLKTELTKPKWNSKVVLELLNPLTGNRTHLYEKHQQCFENFQLSQIWRYDTSNLLLQQSDTF